MTAAGLAWVGLLLAVAVTEWLLVRTHQYTLSEWVWAMDGRHVWFRAVVLAGVAALMIHFFVTPKGTP